MTLVKKGRPSLGCSGDSPTVVVVGRRAAKALAVHLDETTTVRYASSDQQLVRQATNAGLDAGCVDETDAGSLCPVTEHADAAVVVFDSNRSTLLTAQLLRVCCNVEDVFATVTEPAHVDAFEGTGIRLLDTQSWLAGIVREELALSAVDA
ncbi:NAD-binding protein [Halorientalis brevis]|uniref:NAD-binding protein n=1 Tax=Halorientalis brevis TaxID=1126241 RepID=A0ABD6C929_9EURY|nr:NAD-binding protein [Halorientalis brevis]